MSIPDLITELKFPEGFIAFHTANLDNDHIAVGLI